MSGKFGVRLNRFVGVPDRQAQIVIIKITFYFTIQADKTGHFQCKEINQHHKEHGIIQHPKMKIWVYSSKH